MSESKDRQQTIEAEAAGWIVRLEAGQLDADERRAFEAWLDRGEAHVRALDYARSTWVGLGRLRTEPASAELTDARADPAVAHRTGVSRRRVGGSLTASLILAMVGIGVFYAADPITALRADYRTAPGEVRTVTLPDGSLAALDTRTAIAVDFDGDRREIALLDGAAVFTAIAAADAGGRPFVVLTAGGEAKALGTRFLVRAKDGAANVAVLEHRVAVTPPKQGDGRDALVLRAGQAVRYDRSGRLDPVRAIDPEEVATWRRGTLVFDRVLLSDAVAELNRYRRVRIVVMDPALAERRVSGVFRLDDLDSAIGTIAAELDASVLSVPPLVTALY